LCGYFVSIQLESLKRRHRYEPSINNKRAKAVGEVLARVADYEFTLRQVACLERRRSR